MGTESVMENARRELRRYQKLADGAMAQVSDEGFFAVPGEADNSVAVIVKHVGGNALSRWTDFLTSDGEKPGRNRDGEFELGAADTRAALMDQWARGWAACFAALDPLTDEDLGRPVKIRGEPLTVLQAVIRQVAHYAYHVGQIVYVSRHQVGGSWKSLSIPKGQSASFNAAPKKYLS